MFKGHKNKTEAGVLVLQSLFLSPYKDWLSAVPDEFGFGAEEQMSSRSVRLFCFHLCDYPRLGAATQTKQLYSPSDQSQVMTACDRKSVSVHLCVCQLKAHLQTHIQAWLTPCTCLQCHCGSVDNNLSLVSVEFPRKLCSAANVNKTLKVQMWVSMNS